MRQADAEIQRMPCEEQKATTRPRTVSFDPFTSPVVKPNSDPISFETPIKCSRARSSTIDDDTSTIAPSPGGSTVFGCSDSPWCSPAQPWNLSQKRGTFHMSKVPSMPNPLFDFTDEDDLHPGEFDLNSAEPFTMKMFVDGAEALSSEESPPSTPRRASPADSPPCTPRNQATNCLSDATAAVVNITPPSTPRKAAYNPFPTSPPPAPRNLEPPSCRSRLRSALASNSIENVHKALLSDPDSARFPFWDHEVEPPLCFALKRKCSADIVRVLLEHGADVDATDVRGRGPNDIVRSLRTDPAIYPDVVKIENMLGVPHVQNVGIPEPVVTDIIIGEDFLFESWLAGPAPNPGSGPVPGRRLLGNVEFLAKLENGLFKPSMKYHI